VPLGIVGALDAAHLRGLSDDIYFKVGLLTTVGLATKNAILIVEYAKAEQEAGRSLLAAVRNAALLRFRPIVMTSLAFGFGVLPLAISTGAGAASRRGLGTGVLGGVIAATVLVVLLVPVFFVIVRKMFGEGGTTEDDSRPPSNAPSGNSPAATEAPALPAGKSTVHESKDGEEGSKS